MSSPSFEIKIGHQYGLDGPVEWTGGVPHHAEPYATVLKISALTNTGVLLNQVKIGFADGRWFLIEGTIDRLDK